MPEKPREVGFPDGQFMGNGVDETSALRLSDCWKHGNHDKATEIIASLPNEVQPVAGRIYERLTNIEPREGLYE